MSEPISDEVLAELARVDQPLAWAAVGGMPTLQMLTLGGKPMGCSIADLARELLTARGALRIYADKANWTDHRDWPSGDKGCVVLSRDARRRDMDTPGWTEARTVLPEYANPEPGRG